MFDFGFWMLVGSASAERAAAGGVEGGDASKRGPKVGGRGGGGSVDRRGEWAGRTGKGAGRNCPSPACGSAETVPVPASIPSWRQIQSMRSMRASNSTDRKLKCWQREAMVAGILCASVVHNRNTTQAGGSSMVFSSALKASLVIWWASSTMKTL